jgi:uncharacterized coiled-coil protein SlyX
VSELPVHLDADRLQQRILVLRGERVMIDSDLAELYGVTTKRFNEQVKRNLERFPIDFMFQLTAEEKTEVVANCDHLAKLKFSPHLPRVFTEHGAIMAASVLNSPQAVEMSVFVVRAFVRLRRMLIEHKVLAERLDELEARVARHDNTLSTLVATIRQMATPPATPLRQIGFVVDPLEKKQ